MATENKNLSHYDKNILPSGKGKTFAIVTSEWNNHITFNLRDGAKDTLIDLGVDEKDIILMHVPGSFELVYGADKIAQKYPYLDGIITVGCVIRGETAHFDYVCQGVTHGIQSLNQKHPMPIIFCLLTDENEQQSLDRSGGKHGNKGVEAGVAAVIMADFKSQLS